MDDFCDPYQEHLDFEAGAEDMELRAMRLEAERDLRMEAMYDAMDREDEIRACREAEGEELAPMTVPAPMDFGDDDLPF